MGQDVRTDARITSTLVFSRLSAGQRRDPWAPPGGPALPGRYRWCRWWPLPARGRGRCRDSGRWQVSLVVQRYWECDVWICVASSVLRPIASWGIVIADVNRADGFWELFRSRVFLGVLWYFFLNPFTQTRSRWEEFHCDDGTTWRESLDARRVILTPPFALTVAVVD